MIDSLEVEVLYPAWWRRRVSEAQGRRREAGSEGSVEQSRGLMDKNRITRPTRPDERAADREVHSHQRVGVVNPAGVRWRRSVLPREICVVSFGTEIVARRSDRSAEVSRRHSRRQRAAEGL